jgi:hypothetical protein
MRGLIRLNELGLFGCDPDNRIAQGVEMHQGFVNTALRFEDMERNVVKGVQIADAPAPPTSTRSIKAPPSLPWSSMP